MRTMCENFGFGCHPYGVILHLFFYKYTLFPVILSIVIVVILFYELRCSELDLDVYVLSVACRGICFSCMGSTNIHFKRSKMKQPFFLTSRIN